MGLSRRPDGRRVPCEARHGPALGKAATKVAFLLSLEASMRKRQLAAMSSFAERCEAVQRARRVSPRLLLWPTSRVRPRAEQHHAQRRVSEDAYAKHAGTQHGMTAVSHLNNIMRNAAAQTQSATTSSYICMHVCMQMHMLPSATV